MNEEQPNALADVGGAAAQGAAAGAQVGGPIGAAIGLIGGATIGAIGSSKRQRAWVRQQQQAYGLQLTSRSQYGASVLANYPTNGIKNVQLYI